MTTEPQPQEKSEPASGDLVPPTTTAPAPPVPPPPPEFSVELSIPYPQRQSRLLLFGKWFTVIPLVFWLWAYSLVAGVVGLIGVVIVLFAGRYPRGMWDFYRRFLERQWKVQAYFPFFLSDSWTGRGIELRVDYPERQSRLLVLGRILLAPLASLLTAGAGFALYLAMVLAWFTILFTGRQPHEFFDFTLRIVQWQARIGAWQANLRDERRLFRAPRSVWIATIVGLLVVLPIYGIAFAGIVGDGLSNEGEAVVRDFMTAGAERDLTRAPILQEDPEAAYREIEQLFTRRDLFDGYIRNRFDSWRFNASTEKSTMELWGRVDYTTPIDGEFYALPVQLDQEWKIRTICITGTAKVDL